MKLVAIELESRTREEIPRVRIAHNIFTRVISRTNNSRVALAASLIRYLQLPHRCKKYEYASSKEQEKEGCFGFRRYWFMHAGDEEPMFVLSACVFFFFFYFFYYFLLYTSVPCPASSCIGFTLLC